MTAEQKLEAFEVLMHEASSAIADMAETIKAGQGTHDEIAATLADMAAALESRKALPINDLVAAVKALRITPAVNVTNEITVPPAVVNNLVQPTEIRFLPDPTSSGATWEVTLPGRYGESDRVMTIKRMK